MPNDDFSPKAKTPWHFLLCIPVYLCNIALIVAFQCLFIHTIPGPVTAEKLRDVPAFAGTEVLDVSQLPAQDGAWPGTGATFPVLYRTAGGAQYIALLDGNLVLNRFGVIPGSAREVENGVARIPTRLGARTYHVQDGKVAEAVVPDTEHRRTALTMLTAGGLALLAVEIAVLRLVSRRRKNRRAREAAAA